jgi:hypothetical protein
MTARAAYKKWRLDRARDDYGRRWALRMFDLEWKCGDCGYPEESPVQVWWHGLSLHQRVALTQVPKWLRELP